MSDNYRGIITKISNLRKIDKADRLMATNIFGNTIIVSINTQVGDLGIYFPTECALSQEYIFKNNLSSKPELNENGTTKGYFGTHGRVKAQTFKGEKSMGFWMPISSLNYLNIPSETLVEGYELDEYNGHNICSKYIPPVSTSGSSVPKSGRAYNKKHTKVIPDQFKFHYDTSHLGPNMHRIHPNDVISITWKFHGTSAIAANVLCKKPEVSKWKKFINLIRGIETPSVGYEYLYASRNVVKNEWIENDPTKRNYYGYDLWSDTGRKLFEGKLHAGETVYYEIVGYTQTGRAIQKMGKDYDYNCQPIADEIYSGVKSQSDCYVYRITNTNAEGRSIDLEWKQVKERCKELSVKHVPEIYHGYAYDFYPSPSLIPTEDELKTWRVEFLDTLQKAYVHDQDSQFCTNKVPEEGIVLRKEGLHLSAFKLKSFRFCEGESKAVDKGEVDIETEQKYELTADAAKVLDELTEQAQKLDMGYGDNK